MEIVSPVAGSQGFSLWILPPLYVDIAAGVTQGLGTGSVRPLFRAHRFEPLVEPLVDRRRARLARKGLRGRGPREGTQSIAGQRAAYPRRHPAASSTGQRS